jgi:succinate dehydrogenase / fumarate reductase, cytochrome b subunit
MALSIMHRATGVALSLGIFLLVAWLAALASGPETYARFASFAATWPVKVVIALWILSFCYHFANGIRHLLWDLSIGMERAQARFSAKLVVIATLAAAAALLYVFFLRGGAA